MSLDELRQSGEAVVTQSDMFCASLDSKRKELYSGKNLKPFLYEEPVRKDFDGDFELETGKYRTKIDGAEFEFYFENATGIIYIVSLEAGERYPIREKI